MRAEVFFDVGLAALLGAGGFGLLAWAAAGLGGAEADGADVAVAAALAAGGDDGVARPGSAAALGVGAGADAPGFAGELADGGGSTTCAVATADSASSAASVSVPVARRPNMAEW